MNEFTNEEKNLEAIVEQLQRERKRLKRALAGVGCGKRDLSDVEKKALNEKVITFLAENKTDQQQSVLHVKDLVEAEHCFKELRKACQNEHVMAANASKSDRDLREEIKRLKHELDLAVSVAEQKMGNGGKDAEYLPLLRGNLFLKYPSSTTFGVASRVLSSAQPRMVWLSEDLRRICWRAVASKMESSHIQVADIIEVKQGRNTAAFQRFPKAPNLQSASFSIITHKRTLDLEALGVDRLDEQSANDVCSTWVRIIKAIHS